MHATLTGLNGFKLNPLDQSVSQSAPPPSCTTTQKKKRSNNNIERERARERESERLQTPSLNPHRQPPLHQYKTIGEVLFPVIGVVLGGELELEFVDEGAYDHAELEEREAFAYAACGTCV